MALLPARRLLAALPAAALAAQGLGADDVIIGIEWHLTNCAVYSLDPQTGSGSSVGLAGFGKANSMAQDSAGRLYAVGGEGAQGLYTIDPLTGEGTFVAALAVGDVRALAFDADDVLYGIVNGPGVIDHVYVFDPVDGSAQFVGSTGFSSIQGADVAADGTLYAWDIQNGLLTVDTVTGDATDVNFNVGGTFLIQSIVFDDDGTLYGAGDKLYVIDADTGDWATVGTGEYDDLRGVEIIRLADCLQVLNETVTCHGGGTDFTYAVEGVSLCSGASYSVSIAGSGGAPGEDLCMTVIVADELGGFCCAPMLCVPVPDCAGARRGGTLSMPDAPPVAE